MGDRLGRLVREAREKRGEEISELAIVLDCSEAFVKHIEGSSNVPVSERLISALKKHFRSVADKIESASIKRNKVGREYYRNYRLTN